MGAENPKQNSDFAQAHRVPISLAYQVSDGAVLKGLNREDLFKTSMIDEANSGHTSLAHLILLYANIVDATDDLLVGFFDKSFSLSHLILMMRVMMGCETLITAISSMAQLREIGQPAFVELKINGNNSQLNIICDQQAPENSLSAIEELYLTNLYGGLSYFLGRPFPARFMTTRNLQFAQGENHWSLPIPNYQGEVAAFHFPTSLLAECRQGMPVDNIWWTVIETRLTMASSAPLAKPGPISTRTLNTAALCSELGVSPATFRRRNSQSGRTFRQFREQTLVEASLDLLNDCELSVAAISDLLGYGDVRSYRRFIKNATGFTPDQLRANQGAAVMRTGEPKVVGRIMDLAARLGG
jgi:AraC-like DNA-binding protein